MHQRAEMAGVSVIPLAFYGCNSAKLPKHLMKSLAASATTAIWGANREYRSRSLVASWLYRGHQAYPPMALTYARIIAFRRVLRANTQLRGLFA